MSVLVLSVFLLMVPRLCFASSLSNKELLDSVKAQGKRVADDFMSRAKAPNDGGFDYFDACAYYGSCLYGNAVGNADYYSSLYSKYVNSKPAYITVGNVDKNSCGLLPLYLFTLSGDSSLLRLGKAAADNSVENKGYKRHAVDDMYMTGALMVQAYRATNDTGYLSFFAEYVQIYADTLMQPNGLYWHKLTSKNHWGRGNGWGAAGVTELLLELPETHGQYQKVLDVYKKHMKGLIDEQEPTGMWMQLVDDTSDSNWEESSGTAMFVFALFTGLKNGWLDAEEYLEPAQQGWDALVGYLQGSKLTQIAEGFWPTTGQPSDYYKARIGLPGDLHGTAAFLWAATAVINYNSEPPINVTYEHSGFLHYTPSMKIESSTEYKTFFDLRGRVITVNNFSRNRGRPACGIIIRNGPAVKNVHLY